MGSEFVIKGLLGMYENSGWRPSTRGNEGAGRRERASPRVAQLVQCPPFPPACLASGLPCPVLGCGARSCLGISCVIAQVLSELRNVVAFRVAPCFLLTTWILCPGMVPTMHPQCPGH